MKIIKAKRGRARGGERRLKMTEGKEGRNGSTSRHVGIKAGGRYLSILCQIPPTPLYCGRKRQSVNTHGSFATQALEGKEKTMAASLCTEFAASLKQKIKDSKNGKEGKKNTGRSAHCVKTRITIATLAEEDGRIPERWRENIH